LTRELGELPESVKGEYNFWTYICGIVCFSRAFSYLTYPPVADALVSNSIERLVPYTAWGVWLLCLGVALLIGATMQSVYISFFAHLFVTLTYSFLFYSLTFSIILINMGAESNEERVGWAGTALIALFAVLNGWKVWKLGRDIKTKKKGTA
jgi:uncharacterized membrane protein